MIQSPEQINFLNALCNKICNEPHIRFCGVINSMGKLIVGSFRDGIQPLDTDLQREMLYMQSRLEISMKTEFDENLGDVTHVITHRENVIILTIPLKNKQCHVLISAERIANTKKIMDNILNQFESTKRYNDGKNIVAAQIFQILKNP